MDSARNRITEARIASTGGTLGEIDHGIIEMDTRLVEAGADVEMVIDDHGEIWVGVRTGDVAHAIRVLTRKYGGGVVDRLDVAGLVELRDQLDELAMAS